MYSALAMRAFFNRKLLKVVKVYRFVYQLAICDMHYQYHEKPC